MRVTDIAHLLAARAEDVCRHLLPNGTRKGRDWCCGSLNGEPGNSLKICVEGAKAGVWSDFADNGATGDLMGLWQKARGVQLAEACRESQDFLGIPEGDRNGHDQPKKKPIPTRAPSETWRAIQAAMHPGTEDELHALAELRAIPSIAGLLAATLAQQLFFVDISDGDQTHHSWLVTDSSRRNAQARRMDGLPWEKIKAKAKTIHGCEANWPVGAAGLNGHGVALVEGGPDFLAAWHLITALNRDDIRPVAMLGASNAIHEGALPAMANRRVWLFPHLDAAGAKAAARWSEQLTTVGATSHPFNFTGRGAKDLNELISRGAEGVDFFPIPVAQLQLEDEEAAPKAGELTGRPFDSFNLQAQDDPNILLGNRWLCRGDGAILASTSGMGKSSLLFQAAVSWALNRDLFGGCRPTRPLKTLIFQSEDSDGDIAEMKESLFHAMKLSSDEQTQVGERVIVVTDRIHRGLSFRAELKRQLAIHHPDIVAINPLLAFIGGDVNDAAEAGQFLREYLNGLNEPPTHAYIIIHHTAKPPKERADRRWNEVMYDMAGSADLTNWARAIISLRPSETDGSFNLVFAKRGVRAGYTKSVEQGAGSRDEAVTTIGIRHSKERMVEAGRSLPLIHWEPCDPTPDTPVTTNGAGRKPAIELSTLLPAFPVGKEKALGHRAILRFAREIKPSIGNSSLERLIDHGLQLGVILKDSANPKAPKYYLEIGPS